MFLKAYDYLDTIIGAWHDRVTTGNALCVAIARTAPRLIEWWRRHAGISTAPAQTPVVSELAIPFIDWSEVSSVTLCDEAIYHGSRFSSIYRVVRELCDSVVCSPLVVSDEARGYASIRNIIDSRALPIHAGAIPFFIDTVTSRFLELGKPYDIEYPLIYVPFSEPLTAARLTAIATALDVRLRGKSGAASPSRVYTYETYSRERAASFASVTCVVSGQCLVRAGSAVADSSKLRFFADGTRLCIASMSPRTVNVDDVRRDSPLFSGQLLRVWETVYDAASASANRSIAYRLSRERGLVMMANYLLSFSDFLKVSDALSDIIKLNGGGGFSLDESDLCYLCGPRLAPKLLAALSFDMQPSVSRPTPLAVRPRISVIPVPYTVAYTRQMGLDIIGGGTSVSDLVSGQYSAMHWLVEISSRADRGDDASRLNFGESLASMFERCRHFSADNSSGADERLLLGIHKNIDERIDRGSVVPSYVVRSTPTMCYWRQMFRSGENEDLLRDQFLRVMNFIHEVYCHESGTGYVPRLELELILALLVQGDPNSVNPYFACRMTSPLPAVGEAYCCRRHVEGQVSGMVDAAVAYRLFAVDLPGSVTVRSAVAARYSGGTPLSDAQEAEVTAVVKAVARYGSLCGHAKSYIRNILCSLAYDADTLCRRLSSLRTDLAAAVRRGEPVDVAAFTQRFESIFDCFPRVVHKSAEGAVQRRVSEAEIRGDADVRQRGLDAAASRLFVVFNLWSHYCGSGFSRRLKPRFLPSLYKAFSDKVFPDGTSASEWFRTSGYYEHIRECSRDEVISRLSEAINI